MRDRVTFKEKLVVDDGMGGREETWVEKWSCAAHFKPLRDNEEPEGDRIRPRGKGILRVRQSVACDAVTEADIAVINNVDYQIRNIENYDRRNRMIEMVLERGVIL